jgi:hypothetical protein
VSVVPKWLTPKISIFGVDCLYIVNTYDYWYQAILRQLTLISSPYK